MTREIRRLVGRALIGVAAGLCLAPAAQLPGQSRDTESVAQKREDKRRATATFLDRSRTQAERLEAAKHLRYPDPETFPKLLAIGADHTESDAIRLEALRRHPFDDEYIDLVLKILGDPQDGDAELDALLLEDLNRRTTFTLPAELRQRIQTAWRKLLNDARGRVRLSAFRVAVANHDPVAVNRLAESLRRGRDIPVPLPDAIELLDLDGAVNHIGALRPYLGHRDSRVRARAARALAVDPESRPRIVQLVRNPATPAEVRRNALRALAREDDRFATYAIPLLENARENPDIRYAAMHAFAGRMNYSKVEPADQVRFAQAVEKLSRDQTLTGDNAAKIREAARKLLLYLREAFPEIRKHYEKS
jgi:hypothetical protein